MPSKRRGRSLMSQSCRRRSLSATLAPTPLGSRIRPSSRSLIAARLLLRLTREPLAGPLARNTQTGKPIKVRQAYDREFERYLVRAALEKHPQQLAAFLESGAAKSLPLENRLLAALALDPKVSASHVAQL